MARLVRSAFVAAPPLTRSCCMSRSSCGVAPRFPFSTQPLTRRTPSITPLQPPPNRTPRMAAVPPPVPQTQAHGTLLDGKATAATIRAEIAEEVAHLIMRHGEHARPSLVVVVVGDRADSATYVRNKRSACGKVGIRSETIAVPESISQSALLTIIAELNARADVHGVLVQLPLPAHIDADAAIALVDSAKDVDGFHVSNFGALALRKTDVPFFAPCTPQGCLELLRRYQVPIAGRNAVVIGRSSIVGLPVALLLLGADATVTVCHSCTVDTEDAVRGADIVVAACGRAGFVRGEWIKEGAAVVDVGINAVEDTSRERGYRLVGDVEFDEASRRASFITPVPGGVGPMTIAMLLRNTVLATRRQLNLE